MADRRRRRVVRGHDGAQLALHPRELWAVDRRAVASVAQLREAVTRCARGAKRVCPREKAEAYLDPALEGNRSCWPPMPTASVTDAATAILQSGLRLIVFSVSNASRTALDTSIWVSLAYCPCSASLTRW